MHRYKSYSHAVPTTAAGVVVATGTAPKTILQIATPATRQIQLISWGYSLDNSPGVSSQIELIDTNVAATVTAHVASGIPSLDPNAPASFVTLGVSATGYNASAEGTVTASRLLDGMIWGFSGENIPNYNHQFMPDERPIVNPSRFLRIRTSTTTPSINIKAWVCWDE